MAHLFDNLKKKENILTQKRKVRFVLLGSDLPMLLAYEELLRRWGAENVVYICEQEVSWEDFYFPGPGLLRGKENARVMQALYPEIQIQEEEHSSLYYKDQSFRAMETKNKRANFHFLFQEEYFAARRQNFDLSLLSIESLSRIYAELSKNIKICELKGITKISPIEDGVYWEVTCADGATLQCEYLINSLGNKRTHQLLQEKEKFSSQLHEYLQSKQNLNSMVLACSSNVEITPERGTLFVSQNTTQERGHFIGEFANYKHEKGTQEFSFFTFLEEEQMNPEELSKKIKLLKKTIRRVFPQSKKGHIDEKIMIQEKNPCHICDDKLFEKVRAQLPHMIFLGMESPLLKDYPGAGETFQQLLEEIPREQIMGMARSLLSYHQAKETFASLS